MNSPSDTVRLEDLHGLTEVGHGAAAVVYRAVDPDDRAVAVKVFDAVAADDGAAVQFRREAVALERAPAHPSIVAGHGRGRAEDGRPFLVLDLSDGTLGEALADTGPMPPAEGIAMAISLAGALESAHRAGVVHCDVNPANVHRLGDRWALADFGSACVEGVGDADRDGPSPFTLDHAAPEAVRGEPGAPTRDVYGLASTLVAALTGHAPFGEVRHDAPDAIAERIASEPVPDLRRDGLPDGLCRAIESAMSKHPDRRPPTASAFAATLMDAAGDLDVPVLPPLVVGAAEPGATTSVPLAPPSPPERSEGRFAPMLVGIAAAALAFGAALPVLADAIDDGPSSLLFSEAPTEVAAAPLDGGDDDGAGEDAGTVVAEGEDASGEDDAGATRTEDDAVGVGAGAAVPAAGNDGGGNDGGGNGNGGGNADGGGAAATADQAQPVPNGGGGGDGNPNNGGGGGNGNDGGRNGNGGNGRGNGGGGNGNGGGPGI